MLLPKQAFTAYCEEHGMFWQFPARTEQVAASRVEANAPYMPVPWATLIDKHVRCSELVPSMRELARKCDPRPCETTCQHIHWRNLLGVFRELGITVLYTPHKLKGEDFVNGVEVRTCPLFAVNIEDPQFSLGGFDTLPEKPLLYSFMGAWAPHYISRIRLEIFDMPHPPDAVVKHTSEWHLQSLVYSAAQNVQNSTTTTVPADPVRDARTLEYNTLLRASKFSLCPSGAGPGTIRFWESLAAGAVPVLLSDGACLPGGGDDDADEWNRAIVQIQERDVHKIETILRGIIKAESSYSAMSNACQQLYAKYALRKRGGGGGGGGVP